MAAKIRDRSTVIDTLPRYPGDWTGECRRVGWHQIQEGDTLVHAGQLLGAVERVEREASDRGEYPSPRGSVERNKETA